MKLILEKGHSRVPVFYEQPANIIGLILVMFTHANNNNHHHINVFLYLISPYLNCR